jgi:hypothetical protein
VEEVNRLLKQFTEMKKVLAMLGGGGMPKLPKGMKMTPQLAQKMQQQAAAHAAPAGHGQGHGHGKKRKKGGPWGLIKAR